MMRNAKFVALGLLGSFAATGCATKGYVNRSVATVSTAETEKPKTVVPVSRSL